MKLVRKTINVIELTDEEIAAFKTLVEKAEQGHTSHYAEQKMSDGKFFGIAIVPKETHEDMINRLSDQSGNSKSDCAGALERTKWNYEAALTVLRTRGTPAFTGKR